MVKKTQLRSAFHILSWPGSLVALSFQALILCSPVSTHHLCHPALKALNCSSTVFSCSYGSCIQAITFVAALAGCAHLFSHVSQQEDRRYRIPFAHQGVETTCAQPTLTVLSSATESVKKHCLEAQRQWGVPVAALGLWSDGTPHNC